MGENSVEYRDWVGYSHARLCVEIAKEVGVPTRFVVQLECCVGDSWLEVVRFDHDPTNLMSHDITLLLAVIE